MSLDWMGSCCDMWNAKPFYCNSFKLWELAAPCNCAVFVGDRQQSWCLCQLVAVRVVWADRENTYSPRKVCVWVRLRENQKESTHLDQCQVFQIEPEEVISVKRRKNVSWRSHFLQINKEKDMWMLWHAWSKAEALCSNYLCSLYSPFIFTLPSHRATSKQKFPPPKMDHGNLKTA